MLRKLARPLILVSSVAALGLTASCENSLPNEPPAATKTPTPSAQTITINVKAWDFNPGGPVSASLVLTVGTAYRLVFRNVDGPLVENAVHGFTGIPELNLPGTDSIARGGPDFVIDNVTLVPSQRGFYPFSCTNNSCGGDPQQHAGMLGLIIVQ